MICEECENRRSNAANAAQWPILQAWSDQKEWPVNGAMTRLSPTDWKDLLTAAYENETQIRVSPGLNGGMVMLGRRTSHYGRKKFSDWLDWLKAESHHYNIRIPAPAYMEIHK